MIRRRSLLQAAGALVAASALVRPARAESSGSVLRFVPHADLAIIDDNPAFELYDPEYVLDIGVIRSNHEQTSINNALSIDLTGQINSETVTGARMINGTGGQPETHIGAFLSKGGRAITLLQSTALDGAVSRIVPQLEAGALVTVPRYFADTVITEFGIARLLGKNHRERAAEQLQANC